MGAFLPPAREGAAVLAALLLHLGLMATPVALPEGRPVLARSSRGVDATWFDIEAVSGPPAGAARPAPAAAPLEPPRSAAEAPIAARAVNARAEKAPAEAGAKEAARAEVGPTAEVGAEAAPIAEAAPVAPAEAVAPAAPATEAAPIGGQGTPGASEYGPVEPEPGVVAPGLGGAPVWTLPGVLGPAKPAAPAPTAASAPRPVDVAIAGKVLSGTMQSRDRELGLQIPAAGVVASTLATTVRGSEAPQDSRATFEVRLDGGGKVLGVRLVSASAGDAGVWDRVSRKTATALASRALSLGEAGKGGATVIVKVASKLVYPAGNKEKLDVQPVCADEVLAEMAAAFEEVGTSEQKPRPAQRAVDRRFCIPVGIRGKGDASNLGANAETLVTSSYEVVLPGAPKLQAEEVRPVDTRAPWLKDLPSRGPRPPPKKWKPKKKKPKP